MITRLHADLTDLGGGWSTQILFYAEVGDIEAAEGETEVYGAAQS